LSHSIRKSPAKTVVFIGQNPKRQVLFASGTFDPLAVDGAANGGHVPFTVSFDVVSRVERNEVCSKTSISRLQCYVFHVFTAILRF